MRSGSSIRSAIWLASTRSRSTCSSRSCSCSSSSLVRERAPRRVLATVSVALVRDGRAGNPRLRAVRTRDPRAPRRVPRRAARCSCSAPCTGSCSSCVCREVDASPPPSPSDCRGSPPVTRDAAIRSAVADRTGTGCARLGPCGSTSSTAPTSCSASSSRRGPVTRRRRRRGRCGRARSSTSVLGMLEEGATHVGVATDHVIESFRNDLWAELQDRRRASIRC